MTLLIAGDIGGTNTRLQLFHTTAQGVEPESPPQSYPSQKYGDLVPIVEEFCASLGKCPQRACFAIAGPVANNRCTLTNLHWQLAGDRLAQDLQLETVTLINDFAGIGYGVVGLKPEDLHCLQAGERDPLGPIAVIGAGTGLGEAVVIPQANGPYRVFPTEGGHTDFAPRNPMETALLDYFKTEKQLKRVSVERVVSGMGIVDIYHCLRDRLAIPESPTLAAQRQNPDLDLAALIAQGAASTEDPLCQATMNCFVSAYGAEAGNLALKLLPYGGLFIAGGIAAKILPLMEQGEFMAAYRDKGRVSPILDRVPIQVVLSGDVGLVGAALCAAQS
ncbi:MAG: glucokinase [Spirulina sp. DLM2.Bin59]|nr:MAG: glucokinase [Spirulina sp. DLM2.Bin59]